MSYKALYRKYRPATFSDVVGQEHITETLKSELSKGKIFHAYLFTGTRGTGKTSCAKILAKAVNCLSPENGDPCCECEACRTIDGGEVMDIVEIDAASNNSVDNIRDLREQVAFTPAAAKYRVYIIDEVHMLTISAFNALLKTLEEPPAHAIFILATTEVHKLPSTILSRCQRFDFKRIDADKIAERIKYIANLEDFTITDGAASMIAAIADGGMRDALSTLDLCASSDKNIDENTVARVCGMAGDDYLSSLAEFIKNGETESALMLVDKLYNSSVDMLRLLEDMIQHYRNLMIVKTVKNGRRPIICSAAQLNRLESSAENYDIKDIILTLRILQDTSVLMQNGNRRSEMELMLIKLCNPTLRTDIASLEQRITALENAKTAGSSAVRTTTAPPPVADTEIKLRTKAVAPEEPIIPTEEEIPMPEDTDVVLSEAENHIPDISPKPISEDIPAVPTFDNGIMQADTWKKVLEDLSLSAPLLGGILNGSDAYIEGEFLLIDSKNPQFAELMNSGNGIYRDKLRRSVETVTGRTFKLGPYRKKAEAPVTNSLQNLRNRLKDFSVPDKADK